MIGPQIKRKNIYTSEMQMPASGTSCFKIESDILEKGKQSWSWVLGLLFLCLVVYFMTQLLVLLKLKDKTIF
jgi:hypothetical protein